MAKRTKITRSRKVQKVTCPDILGVHPAECHPFGRLLSAVDGATNSGIPYRALAEHDNQRKALVECVREMLTRHHVSPEALDRDRQRREAMKRQGFEAVQSRMRRFPPEKSTILYRIEDVHHIL